jgi:hypothetical protein
MKVKVVQAIYVGGLLQKPGTVIELPDNIVREAIWRGKVEAVTAIPPPSGPMTTETASAVVSGKQGGKSAGGK